MRVWALWLLLGGVAAADEPSPVGTWASAEDQVAPARKIRVTEAGGVLTGRVVATDTARDSICFKCDDDRKGQPVLGMEVLRGARHDGENWLGGQWLEPQTGVLYRARMTLAPDGATLTMRGTVGLALMGRSQVWTRVADADVAKVVQRVPVRAADMTFIGAQGPARDGSVPADFAAQARNVWANLDDRLSELHRERDLLVSLTVVLADRADVAEERAVREAAVGAGVPVTVLVAGLPDRAWLLEISAVVRAP